MSKVVRSDGAKSLTDYLMKKIESGNFPPGYRLPTERELSERFKASRGAVRRVLGNLKEQDLITQVVGSGTFVSDLAGQHLVKNEELVASKPTAEVPIQTSPAQLMESRRLIEPQMISLIVRYATAVDFTRMDECVKQSESATSIDEFEYWDGALHAALAEATHNSFFLQVLHLTNVVREEGEWGRLKRNSLTIERRQRYEIQHRSIVAALRDRDERTAKALLEDHLREVEQNLFG